MLRFRGDKKLVRQIERVQFQQARTKAIALSNSNPILNALKYTAERNIIVIP